MAGAVLVCQRHSGVSTDALQFGYCHSLKYRQHHTCQNLTRFRDMRLAAWKDIPVDYPTPQKYLSFGHDSHSRTFVVAHIKRQRHFFHHALCAFWPNIGDVVRRLVEAYKLLAVWFLGQFGDLKMMNNAYSRSRAAVFPAIHHVKNPLLAGWQHMEYELRNEWACLNEGLLNNPSSLVSPVAHLVKQETEISQAAGENHHHQGCKSRDGSVIAGRPINEWTLVTYSNCQEYPDPSNYIEGKWHCFMLGSATIIAGLLVMIIGIGGTVNGDWPVLVGTIIFCLGFCLGVCGVVIWGGLPIPMVHLLYDGHFLPSASAFRRAANLACCSLKCGLVLSS